MLTKLFCDQNFTVKMKEFYNFLIISCVIIPKQSIFNEHRKMFPFHVTHFEGKVKDYILDIKCNIFNSCLEFLEKSLSFEFGGDKKILYNLFSC